MDRRLRRLLNRTEKAIRGCLVQDWRQHRLSTEESLSQVLRLLKVDCVFDVGANDGGYATMLRDYCGYSGRIISFEPTPDVFAKLHKAASGDDLWNAHGYALGRHDGTAKMQVHHARLGSSFLPVTDQVAHLSGNKIEQEIDVPVKTLNSLFPAFQKEFGFARPFLKMDTQGFDMEVFLGAMDVIDSFIGLQSELSVASYYKGAPFWLDSLAAYEKAGFVLSNFVPSTGGTDLKLHEIDCIMVRQ